MANEFVARNGVFAQNNSQVTGSLIVTNGITGSLFGTSSYSTQAATASYFITSSVTSASFATSASYAASSSFATTASYFLTSSVTSASFATSASYAASSSFATTASYFLTSSVTSASFATSASYAASSSFANTASYFFTSSVTSASYAASSSFATTASYFLTSSVTSASFATSASYASSSTSASYALNATTSSYVNPLIQAVIITGSLAISGSSGTTLFSSNVDTLVLTGSAIITGSVSITGSLNILGSITGSLFGTASYTIQAATASYFITSSVTSASFATSASYAKTSSYADNFTVANQLTATTLIVQTISSSVVYSSGSNVFGNQQSNTQVFTGSVNITGSLNLIGNQTSSGSLVMFGPNNNTPNISTQNSSLILEGNAGGFSSFGSQLRVTANIGAWTDNVTSSYFQIKTTGSFGSNNYVTFQGGTWASDAPFDRLQFASYYTSFNNGAYGTTPVPTASVEIINTNNGAIPLLQLKTLVGQTSNYINVTSGSTVGNVFNITSDGVVAIGTTNTSTEANLFLGAKGTDEGGQLILQKGTAQASASMLDNYQNTFRILTGTDTVSNRADLQLSHVTRNLTIYGDVVAYGSSDKRLKNNIQPIENALDKLDKIGGYTFEWNSDIEIHGHEGNDVGIIAQEIEEVLPEVVITRDNGYKAVKYEKIVPLLIQCIKELKDEIRDLKSQN